MTVTNWRPANWERIYIPESRRFAFEAGADAMLKKIRELNTSTVPSSEFRDGKFRTGKWVFIPDGDTND